MVPSLSRPTEKQFTTRRPSSCTRRCSVRVSSIAENSSLLPPVGVWAVLNPSVAARPLRPATDRRFGRPLPHQLANRAQSPLPALSQIRELSSGANPRLCGLVTGFPVVFPTRRQISTCYSPVRHSLCPCGQRTFDLHVLGTPPALILSQDQTRHPVLSARSRLPRKRVCSWILMLS